VSVFVGFASEQVKGYFARAKAFANAPKILFRGAPSYARTLLDFALKIASIAPLDTERKAETALAPVGKKISRKQAA
jgi:hypothetical protein